MKRSEMIKELTEIELSESGFKLTYEEAKKLLDVIELIGMKPPEFIISYDFLRDSPTNFFDLRKDGPNYITIKDWIPEEDI